MIKNAFAYITRKSLKSIIIMLVILAMSTLSLISLSIKDATDRASKETFANITNSFSMEINRQVNPGTPRGGGNVKGEDIKKIAQTDSIDSYVKRINSVADLVDYDIIETKETLANQSPKRAKNFKRTVMLTGVNDSSKETKFVSEAYKLVGQTNQIRLLLSCKLNNMALSRCKTKYIQTNFHQIITGINFPARF